MKLKKKNCFNLNIMETKLKFIKCSPRDISRGDYLKVAFFWSNPKRRKGIGIRVYKQTGILLRKLVKRNSMTIILSVLFKFEKVKFYLTINSPQVITVLFVKRCLKRNLLKNLLK